MMNRSCEVTVDCGICGTRLPIDPETGRRFIFSDAVECQLCGAPTASELEFAASPPCRRGSFKRAESEVG
jgi:hypothetical protein